MSDKTEPRHARLSAASGLLRENPVLLGIAGIGFCVSFQTIARLARSQDMPGWPVLYPVLIDLGILGFIVEARKAIDDGRSDLMPRIAAWVLSVFTIYVNAHGSPAGDWLGVALHVVAPALWVAFLELTRWRKLRGARKGRQDRVPLRRWLLSPWRTAGMWKRMVLHNVTSYPVASAREEARLLARDLVKASLGKRWRKAAPALLVHHLEDGALPAEVTRVCEMASLSHRPAVAEAVDTWVTEALTRRDKLAAKVATERRAIAASAETPDATPAPRQTPRQAPRQNSATDRAKANAKAARLMTDNPAMPLEDVAARTGVSKRTASRIKSALPTRLRVAE